MTTSSHPQPRPQTGRHLYLYQAVLRVGLLTALTMLVVALSGHTQPTGGVPTISVCTPTCPTPGPSEERTPINTPLAQR